jgi:hypothetical protein
VCGPSSTNLRRSNDRGVIRLIDAAGGDVLAHGRLEAGEGLEDGADQECYGVACGAP